jgi:tRNA nucleotidyltransferase (CCA-adding enzyme)
LIVQSGITWDRSFEILRKMESLGFESYLVGGSVRDLILYGEYKDMDIATSGTPDDVINIFSDCSCNDIGKKFGGITIHLKEEIQFTAFRKDNYLRSRKPEVEFIKNAEIDSNRRDFTINALYLSYNGEILDFHGGFKDTLNRKIIFIGDTLESITNDPLRILRYFRFMLNHNLKPDFEQLNIVKSNIFLVSTLSKYRLESEFVKIINSKLKYTNENNVSFNLRLDLLDIVNENSSLINPLIIESLKSHLDKII